MKNRLYILITIILAAFVCFSCKSELDKPGKENAAKQGIKIKSIYRPTAIYPVHVHVKYLLLIYTGIGIAPFES